MGYDITMYLCRDAAGDIYLSFGLSGEAIGVCLCSFDADRCKESGMIKGSSVRFGILSALMF